MFRSMESGATSISGGGQKWNTVLVADDSASIRTRLALLVGRLPGVSTVAQAASAQEVMELLPRIRPLVALIDVHLDDRGGAALIERIKQEFPSVVLVAMTRYAGPQLAANFRECGADYCFDKTSELELLLQTIERLNPSDVKNEPPKENP